MGQVFAHADAEGAQLDIANSRQAQTIVIVQRCEDWEAKLVKSLTHKSWWPF